MIAGWRFMALAYSSFSNTICVSVLHQLGAELHAARVFGEAENL
jgi:hypothetical protein